MPAALGRRGLEAGAALLLVVLLATPLSAQDASAKLRAQRDELDRIRSERSRLEQQMSSLRASVHDLSQEVANLNAQRATTERLLAALDRQLATIAGEVDEATQNMSSAERELLDKRATLKRRLTDIYKRGPMFTAEAMLSAQSFGELVARYKYLHTLALHDRALVTRVEELRDQVSRDRTRLMRLQEELEYSRHDRQMEEENLRLLQREQSAKLAAARTTSRRTAQKLAQLRRTENQLAGAIASLEAARRRADARRTGSAPSRSSISTSDYGQLAWPVEGPLVYTFGKAQTASNATIRWNGVGIQAPVGTAVKAVAAGKVVSVGQLGTYGTTIIVEHGGGDYSIYGSLARSDVKLNQTVKKGETLGTVGISDPDLPPHLHFEIRHGGPAVDPASWLRGERF